MRGSRWLSTNVPAEVPCLSGRPISSGTFRIVFNGHATGNPPMDPIVTSMAPGDWEAVRRIYKEAIATGHASFDTDVPDWDAWDRSHLKACRLVARADGEIAGWAALSPVSSRCIHAGVAEVSVYVGSGYRGRGVGKALMRELVDATERAGSGPYRAGCFRRTAPASRLRRHSVSGKSAGRNAWGS